MNDKAVAPIINTTSSLCARATVTAARLPSKSLQDGYAVVGYQTARAYSAPFSSFTSKTRSL